MNSQRIEEARDWLRQLFVWDVNMRQNYMRAAHAQHLGLDPAQYTRPFPGSPTVVLSGELPQAAETSPIQSASPTDKGATVKGSCHKSSTPAPVAPPVAVGPASPPVPVVPVDTHHLPATEIIKQGNMPQATDPKLAAADLIRPVPPPGGKKGLCDAPFWCAAAVGLLFAIACAVMGWKLFSQLENRPTQGIVTDPPASQRDLKIKVWFENGKMQAKEVPRD